jgi:predicted nucleotidyltransferase component of viral defense system
VLTRQAITKRADQDGVTAVVAERDYVLAHVVGELHRAALAEGRHLVFKGGTAMRFVYLKDFRYSADLDFTILGGNSADGILALAPVIDAAREHTGLPHLEIVESRPPTVAYIGPLAAGKPRTIKLDIADDEHVETIDHRSMYTVWEDLPSPVPFNVYSLDEIAAEKLRCIIQRVQCRDLYDLHRLGDDLDVDFEQVAPLFERKTERKGLDPRMFSDRFEARIKTYRRKWDEEMSTHLGDRSSKHGILFHACLLSSWGRYKLHAGLVLFLGTSFRSAEPVWCLCT